MRTALLFIFISALFCINASAQKLKSTETLPVARGKNITNSYVDGSGQLLRIYTVDHGSGTLHGGTFSGFPIIKSTDGIVFMSGRTVSLKPLEKVQSVNGTKMLTGQTDTLSGYPTYRVYNIVGEKLELRRSITLKASEISIDFRGSKNLIFNDFSEGYGTYVKICNTDLDSLSEYVPFKKGYSEMRLSASNKYLIGAFIENSGDSAKITVFDPNTGKVINERPLMRTAPISSEMMAFDDKVVMDGGFRYEARDLSGKLLWSKDSVINQQVWTPSDDRWIYFFSKEEIIGLDPATGAKRWSQPIPKLPSNAKLDENGWPVHVRLIQFVKEKDGAGFLLGIAAMGTMPMISKIDCHYIKVDHAGNKVFDITIPGKTRQINVAPTANGFRIFADERVFNYEY